MSPDPSPVRLHVVTGKGGTGKTTVAAALALALAADGRQVLLVETEETVSRVYHELKRLLPADSALLVAPVERRPKAKGVTEGTVFWLRDRLPLPDRE